MARRLIAVVLLGASLAHAQNAPDSRSDSAMLARKDSVVAAHRRFQFLWDTLWTHSERARHSFSYITDALYDGDPRRLSYHCHPRDARAPGNAVTRRQIVSKGSFYAVCPSFDLGDVVTTVDERARLDDALEDSRRELARSRRAALIRQYDSVAALLPSDDFIVGQLVRLLVDQWEYDGAERIAKACRATRWWCAMLAGYVHGARGEVVKAESAFAAAFAAMSERERCEWTDYRLVIDFASRDKYGAGGCGRRAEVNERLWWLADPLYIEAGNERKVEQDVRSVLLALRTDLGRDERFAWGNKRDDDARQVMVLRYGWPSYAFWGGPLEDRAHTGYLAGHGTSP
jgi:hypothetical protein